MTKKLSQLSVFQLSAIGLLAIIISFSFWALVKADGTTITMCVKDSGDSYVIGSGFKHQSCKNNEQLLSFNVTGPQGIQGPQGPAGPEGASVKVFDANNSMVGYVTKSDETGFEFFDKTLKVFSRVDGRSNFPTNNVPVMFFYAGNDCTGQAYASQVDSDFNLYRIVSSGTNTTNGLYVFDQATPIGTFAINSTDSGGPNCQNGAGFVSGRPLINVTSTINSYALPFHIGL